jgi:hypothetical protein
MVDENKWLERIDNLYDLMKELCVEEIRTNFNERDLKELIWLIGDYKAIKEELNEKR